MQTPSSEVSLVEFFVLGNYENEVESVAKIEKPDIYEDKIPVKGGVLDAAMGSTEYEYYCNTCRGNKNTCPGHYGSVTLNMPVISPLYVNTVKKFLKIVCFTCASLLEGEAEEVHHPRSKEYIKYIRSKNTKECRNCGAVKYPVSQDLSDNISFYQTIPDGYKTVHQYISPALMEHVFKRFSAASVAYLGLPETSHPSKFILRTIRAPPNSIRPSIHKIDTSRNNTNDITAILQHVIKINNKFNGSKNYNSVLTPDDIATSKLLNVYYSSMIVDSSSRGVMMGNSQKQIISLTGRFKQKKGRIKKNLNGRRVHRMARGFITCNPTLEPDKVGISKKIAKSVQIPVTVRSYNFLQLNQYFKNGVKDYPGCTHIRKASNGKMYHVANVAPTFRLEEGDILWRDIITGDKVHFNRQPSLEPSSITAMRVEVRESGDTFEMSETICGLFAADFDGDAMNIQFPTSERFGWEIFQLASTAEFFINMKNSTPKIGLIQDCILGLAFLTLDDCRIDKLHAMRLYGGVSSNPNYGDIVDPMQSIQGRDVLSRLMIDCGTLIDLKKGSAFYQKNYTKYIDYHNSDQQVVIEKGKLLSGVVDKSTVGKSATGGIFHTIHNMYGPNAALRAVYNFQQIARQFLYNHGATMSLADLVLRDSTKVKIQDNIRAIMAEAMSITHDLNEGKIVPPIGMSLETYYESKMFAQLSSNDLHWGPIFENIDPIHHMMCIFIFTGARGELFNLKNIVAAIQQIEINGMRMVEDLNGRALAYYTRCDENPKARGFITNSYTSGLKNDEFAFHTQDTRFALINKSMNTSITGAANRKGIKSMESLVINNHRHLTSPIHCVQLLYGGDGINPKFLERVQFPTLDPTLGEEEWVKKFVTKVTDAHVAKEFKGEGSSKLFAEEELRLREDRNTFLEVSGYIEYANAEGFSHERLMAVNVERVVESVVSIGKSKGVVQPVQIRTVQEFCELLPYNLINEIQEKKRGPIPDHFYLATRQLCILVRGILTYRYMVLRGITPELLDAILIKIKTSHQDALIGYGICAGIFAVQSIFESLTQMMLSAHHTVGHESVKKTGVYRVEELTHARGTESMKAPTMIINLLGNAGEDRAKVEAFANKIEQIKVKDIMVSSCIFIEEIGNPKHPISRNDTWMKGYMETNPGETDRLINICLRIVMNKYKLIEKQLSTQVIYISLMEKYNRKIYVMYCTEEAKEIVFRVYFYSSEFKTDSDPLEEIQVLEQEIYEHIIRGVKGVQAAYISEKNVSNVSEAIKEGNVIIPITHKKVYFVHTLGTNLQEILTMPEVDINNTLSDSILEMNELFGIDCARDRIIIEFKAQMSGKASDRHFGVLADQMTVTGQVTAINRFGTINRKDSPLNRISDSNSVDTIRQSALTNAKDTLDGVGGSILLSLTPKIGTLYNTFVMDDSMEISDELINVL